MKGHLTGLAGLRWWFRCAPDPAQLNSIISWLAYFVLFLGFTMVFTKE
jgi:hypothetical protein